MKIRYLLLFALSIMVACENNDEGKRETNDLLTLTVDESYLVDGEYLFGADTDDWIIIHGQDGTLLAAENFEDGREYMIVTDKPVKGKISITHLRCVITEQGDKSYTLKTYTGIEKGIQVRMKGAGPIVVAAGTIDVSVSNVFNFEYGLLTTRFGTLNNSAWNGGSGKLDMQAPRIPSATKYIATVATTDELKYKILDDVESTSTFSFSFDEMTDYENKVQFSFPQADFLALFVSGSDPGEMSTTNEFMMDTRLLTNISAVETGYIQSLTHFKTKLVLIYPDRSYEYVNVGSIPEDVTWPEIPELTYAKSSFKDFSVTASTPYVWRKSFWGHQDVARKISIVWNVSATSGEHKINKLPQKLINAHPDLSLNNLTYNGTTFFTQSPGYESIFANEFQAAAEPDGVTFGVGLK